MRKLKLLSLINDCQLKGVSVRQLLCSKKNQQSMDDNVGRYVSAVNQPIPLPLNDNTATYGGNWVSVSELKLSGMSGACHTWLIRKWWSG